MSTVFQLAGAKSVQSWKDAVDRLIPEVKRLPVGTGSLPPDFKKFLAKLIKNGTDLASGMSSWHRRRAKKSTKLNSSMAA